MNLTSKEYFTARQAEISWLLDALRLKRIVTLWGPGGIGKSAIVQAALERLSPYDEPPQRFPDGVIVHSFYGQPDTASFGAHIVRSLIGETAQDVTAFAAQRALSNKKLLLVLDGTEEAADLGAVLHLCGDNGVLITTRNRGDARSPEWRLAIETLTLNDAWGFLQKWDIKGLTEPLGRQICQFVDGWPLAIRIIGSYLDATSEPPEDYWDWLESTPVEALSPGQHREESVDILLSRSVKRLSDGARQIIEVIGLLAPAPIERELFVTSLTLPKQESQLGIGELVRYGLLRQQEEQLEVGHALIHRYARRQPTQEVVSALTSKIREKVNSLRVTPILLFDWLPHFRAITDYAVERAEDAEGAALCNDLGHAMHLIADYANAQTYYKQALAIREIVLGPEHPHTADSLISLATLLKDKGEYEEARPYYERALAIHEKALGSEHPHTAKSLGYLATLLKDLGDYGEARPYLERALAINEKILGPEHPDAKAIRKNLNSL